MRRRIATVASLAPAWGFGVVGRSPGCRTDQDGNRRSASHRSPSRCADLTTGAVATCDGSQKGRNPCMIAKCSRDLDISRPRSVPYSRPLSTAAGTSGSTFGKRPLALRLGRCAAGCDSRVMGRGRGRFRRPQRSRRIPRPWEARSLGHEGPGKMPIRRDRRPLAQRNRLLRRLADCPATGAAVEPIQPVGGSGRPRSTAAGTPKLGLLRKSI